MKKDLRKSVVAQRKAMSRDEVTAKSGAICEKLVQLITQEKYKTVMVYIPEGNEVDIYPVIRELLAKGKRVVAPICVKIGFMVPSLITDLDNDLAPGRYGILAPKEERLIPLEEIDAVIVPGVCFDKKGNRLGMGAGYYDRFLPTLREDAKKIAICYDFQSVDELEVEPWDFPADMVVTESSI